MVNKKDLVGRIRSQLQYKYKPAELELMISAIVDTILNACENGEEVSIPNFGKFYPRHVKGKTIKQNGISWLQGKEFTVPDRFLFGFKPSSFSNDRVNQLTKKINKTKSDEKP